MEKQGACENLLQLIKKRSQLMNNLDLKLSEHLLNLDFQSSSYIKKFRSHTKFLLRFFTCNTFKIHVLARQGLS